MGASAVKLAHPCPMTQDAPKPLCAQKCAPDKNAGKLLDLPEPASAGAPPSVKAVDPASVRAVRFTPPIMGRQTGPPLYIAFLHLRLP